MRSVWRRTRRIAQVNDMIATVDARLKCLECKTEFGVHGQSSTNPMVPSLEWMSWSVWLHCVCMLVYALLVLPIALCATRPTTPLHGTAHAIGLFVMSIGMLCGVLTTRFSSESAPHVIGGIVTYLALLTTAMLGGASGTTVRDAKVDARALARTHTQCSRVLLYGALPLQLLTGLSTALHLGDERLSGAAAASAAALGAAVFVCIAGAYAYMSLFVKRSSSMPTLLRAYSSFAAESAAVFIAGVGSAFLSLYLAAGLTSIIVSVVTSTIIAIAGCIGLVRVRHEATHVRHIPQAVVRGVPIVLVLVTTACSLLLWPARASTYARVASAIIAVSLLMAGILRYALHLALIPLPLSVAATMVMMCQSGIEQLYDVVATTPLATVLWWVLTSAVGVTVGVLVYLCCALEPETEQRRRRPRRRERTPDELDRDVVEFVGEDL